MRSVLFRRITEKISVHLLLLFLILLFYFIIILKLPFAFLLSVHICKNKGNNSLTLRSVKNTKITVSGLELDSYFVNVKYFLQVKICDVKINTI